MPHTRNLVDIDPGLPKLNFLTKAEKGKVDVVVSNSFGFGGTNASLVFKKVD